MACLFLGKLSKKVFLAGPDSLLTYMISPSMLVGGLIARFLFYLKFLCAVVAFWSYIRDDLAHLRPEECLDVILWPLAVSGYLTSFCLINGEFRAIVRR